MRNNQDNIAINIKLKSGKSVFGLVMYLWRRDQKRDFICFNRSFFITVQSSINFIGDVNNIGEVALSRRDIRGFTGGFRSPSNKVEQVLT